MALKKSSKKFVVSDESINSYGFKVLTSGIQTADFLNNPVCLFNHNPDKVIGLWQDLGVSGSIMTGIPAFDENDDEALKVFQKVEDDIIKGSSIGITALAWDGDMITECILKEITVTPLPSNKNAVVLYNQEGIILSDDQAKQYLLSLKPADTNTDINKSNKMNEKSKKALIALALEMGVTLMLSDSDERFENIAETATQKFKDLKTQISTQAEEQAVALVDGAIAKNLFTADERDFYLSSAKINYVATAAQIGKMQPVELNINNLLTTGGEAGKAAGAAGGDAADPRKDWTFSDYSKKDSSALYKMQTSDNKKFKELYKAEYNEDYEG